MNLDNNVLLKNNDTQKINEYNIDATTLLLIHNNKLELPSNTELKPLIKINVDDYLKHIKKRISKIDDYIPLLDIFSRRMFMINKHNVYHRVVNEHYRLVNEHLINKMIEMNS